VFSEKSVLSAARKENCLQTGHMCTGERNFDVDLSALLIIFLLLISSGQTSASSRCSFLLIFPSNKSYGSERYAMYDCGVSLHTWGSTPYKLPDPRETLVTKTDRSRRDFPRFRGPMTPKTGEVPEQ